MSKKENKKKYLAPEIKKIELTPVQATVCKATGDANATGNIVCFIATFSSCQQFGS